MNIRFPKMPRSLLKPPPGFKKPLVKDFKADMQRLGEDIAEEFKETVTDNIETNAFGFTLADSTINRKGDATPLIDSGELLDSIYRDGTTVSVENTPRSDSSLTNLQLAIVQEYGTKDKHIPPRPVWRNTFREYKSTAKERVDSFLRTSKFKK